MIVVLDASAGIEIALDRPRSEEFTQIVGSADKVVSSELYKAEVANVIWKYVRAGLMPNEMASQKLEQAQDIVDEFIDISENNDEALSESIRIGHPVYDILYLTLARRNGAKLLTVDKKLKAVCEKSGVSVVG